MDLPSKALCRASGVNIRPLRCVIGPVIHPDESICAVNCYHLGPISPQIRINHNTYIKYDKLAIEICDKMYVTSDLVTDCIHTHGLMPLA
jgi:hypothetical protein